MSEHKIKITDINKLKKQESLNSCWISVLKLIYSQFTNDIISDTILQIRSLNENTITGAKNKNNNNDFPTESDVTSLNDKLNLYYANNSKIPNIKFLRDNYTSGEIEIAINHIIRKGMYTYKETTGVDSSSTDFTVDGKTYSIKHITNKLIKDTDEYNDGDAVSFDNKIEYRKMPDYSKLLIRRYKNGTSIEIDEELTQKLTDWKAILDNDNNSCIFSSSILDTKYASRLNQTLIDNVRTILTDENSDFENLTIGTQTYRFGIDIINPNVDNLPESFLFSNDTSNSNFDGNTFNTNLTSPHALCIIGYYQEDPEDIETLYWLAWDSDQARLLIIKYDCLAISSESYYIPEKDNGKNVLQNKVLSNNIDKVGTYNKIGFNTVRSLPAILRDSKSRFKSILLRWFKHDFDPTTISGNIDLSGMDQQYTITGTQISEKTRLSKLNPLEKKCIEKVYNHTSNNTDSTSTSGFIANLKLEKIINLETFSYRPSNRVLVKMDVSNMPCGGYELDEQNDINTLTSLGVHIPYKNGEVDISIYSQLESTSNKTIVLPRYSRRSGKSSDVSFATVNETYRIGGTNVSFENTDAGLYQIPVTTRDGNIINLTTTNVYIMITYTAPDYFQNHFSSDDGNEAIQKAYNYSTSKMLNNYKTYNYGKNNNCDMFGMPFERDIPARDISTNRIYANNREALNYPAGKYGGWDNTVKEWYSVSYLDENNNKQYAKLMNDSNFNKDMNFVLYVYGKDNESTGAGQAIRQIEEDLTIKEVSTSIQIETPGIITIPENDVNSIQLTSNKTPGTIEWTIVGGADQNIFSINENTGLITFSALDYESPLDSDTNNSYEVLVQASHSSGTTTKTFTIKVSDQPDTNIINDAFIPSNITVNVGDRFICELKTDSIREASTSYNVVWSVNDTDTYEIIDNRYLLLKDEQTLTNTVTVNAITGDITQTKIINLTRANNTIQISTDNILNITENTRDIETIAASTDTFLEKTTQSNDGSLFQLKNTGVSGISTNVLQWKNDVGADYENPSSFPLNTNIYKVTLKARKISSTETETIEKIFLINVTDVDDATPQINTSDRLSIDENLTDVVTLTSDKDVSWSITGGDDRALFKIVSGNNLVFKNARDFEIRRDNDRNNEYIVKVRATRTNNVDNNIFSEKTLYVTINNVVEDFEFETSFGQLFQQFPYHNSKTRSSNNGDTEKNISKTITIKNITGVPNGANIFVRFKDKDNSKTNAVTNQVYNGETTVVIDLQEYYKTYFTKATNSRDVNIDPLRFFIEIEISKGTTVYSRKIKKFFYFLDQYEPFTLNNLSASSSITEIPSGRAKKVKNAKNIQEQRQRNRSIDTQPKEFKVEQQFWIKGDTLQVNSPDLSSDGYTRSYQWYRITDDQDSMQPINGATTDTYTVIAKDVEKSNRCVGKLDVNVVYSKGRDKFGFTLSNYIDPLKNYILKDSFGWRSTNVKFTIENSLELMKKDGSSYTRSDNQYIYNIGTPFDRASGGNQQLNWCNDYITSLSVRVKFLENLSEDTNLKLEVFQISNTDNFSRSVFETEKTTGKDSDFYIFGEIENSDEKSLAEALKQDFEQSSNDPTGKFYDIRVSTIDEPRNFVEKRIAIPKLVVTGRKNVDEDLRFQILPTKYQLENNLSNISTFGDDSINFSYVLKRYTYTDVFGWDFVDIIDDNDLEDVYTLTSSENDTYVDVTGTISINGANNASRNIIIGDINASCYDVGLHNNPVGPELANAKRRREYNYGADDFLQFNWLDGYKNITVESRFRRKKAPALDIKYTNPTGVFQNRRITDNEIDYGKNINLKLKKFKNYIFKFEIEPEVPTGLGSQSTARRFIQDDFNGDYINDISISLEIGGNPTPLSSRNIFIDQLETLDYSDSPYYPNNSISNFYFGTQQTISGTSQITLNFPMDDILIDYDLKIGIYANNTPIDDTSRFSIGSGVYDLIDTITINDNPTTGEHTYQGGNLGIIEDINAVGILVGAWLVEKEITLPENAKKQMPALIGTKNLGNLATLKIEHNGYVIGNDITFTISGPHNAWFAIAFDAKNMSEEPYAILVDGEGNITERQLEAYGPGVILANTLQVEQHSVENNLRKIVVKRTINSLEDMPYLQNPGDVNIITAIGNTSHVSTPVNRRADRIRLYSVRETWRYSMTSINGIQKIEDEGNNIRLDTWYRTDNKKYVIRNFDTNYFRPDVTRYFSEWISGAYEAWIPVNISPNIVFGSTLPSENLILKFTAIHKDDFLLDSGDVYKTIISDVARSRRYARRFKLKSNATNYNIQLKSITQNPLDPPSALDPLLDDAYADLVLTEGDVYTNPDSNDFVVSEMNTNNDSADGVPIVAYEVSSLEGAEVL